MKANELRIGNYLIKDGVVVTIDGRTIFDIWSHELGFGLHGYQPIIITRDWLLQFGFEFFKGWWYLDAFSPGNPSQRFDLYWSKDDGFMTKSRYQPDISDQFFMRHIKYIHQVQNLYFALTGEEITIAPPKASQQRLQLEPEQP